MVVASSQQLIAGACFSGTNSGSIGTKPAAADYVQGRSSAKPFYTAAGEFNPQRGRLLLVSYHFPPGQAVGALRWQKMAAIAPEYGLGVDTISAAPACLDGTDELRLAELPAGTRVYGVPSQPVLVEKMVDSLWSAYKRLRGRNAHQSMSGQDKLPTSFSSASPASQQLRWPPRNPGELKRAYFAAMDYARSGAWAKEAARLGGTVVDPRIHRAVISCGPPHMAHVGAAKIASGARLPHVVDMRDPWSLVQRLSDEIASALWLRCATKYERQVLSTAKLIVANTEGACRALRSKYPDFASKIIAVMNGYDEDPIPKPEMPSRFDVVYAGSVYLDRDPSLLFRAAAEVVNEQGIPPEQLQFRFIGNSDANAIGAIAEREGIREYVRVEPGKPRQQLFRDLAGASVLLSLPQDSDMAIPSKVFEYLRFHAWVLALAEPNSATGLALHGSGADVVSPRDVEGMKRVLMTRYREFSQGQRPTPLASRAPLSRREQAKIFFEALETIL